MRPCISIRGSVRPSVGPSGMRFIFQWADYGWNDWEHSLNAPNSSKSLLNCPKLSQNVPKCPLQTHHCPNGLVFYLSIHHSLFCSFVILCASYFVCPPFVFVCPSALCFVFFVRSVVFSVRHSLLCSCVICLFIYLPFLYSIVRRLLFRWYANYTIYIGPSCLLLFVSKWMFRK